MYSKYNTPNKQYLLKTDDFVCNKFGLAEFFANNYENADLVFRIFSAMRLP